MAVLLAALAGYVDSLGFLQLGGLFVSFMSGNSTRMAVGVSMGDWRTVGVAAAILILFITSGAAFAEALPRPGHIDSRVRDVVYNKDNVTAIDASYGTSTMIELQPDEKIETLALGDSIAWKVEPNRKGDIIFVKPVEKNAQSNLNVVTDKRIYSFLLRSNTRNSLPL